MRTWWSAPAAAGLLVLAACGGQGTEPGGTTTAPPSLSATTGATTGTSSPAPTPPTPGATTARPSAAPPTTARPTTEPSPPGPAPRPTTTAPPQPSGAALPAALRGRVLTTVPTSQKVVALTFDGGAGSQGAASILTTLRTHGVPASFFVTGTFASANPAITRQMAALGPVGNHSWSHPDFTTLPASAVHDQLTSTASAVVSATGRDPRPFFRFPFGAHDARTLALVNREGYGAVGWTTDSLGWKGTSGGMTVDAVVARVLAGAAPGQVVLMHVGANPDDGTTLDASALPRIIAGYRSSGYRFVTLGVLR